MNLIKIDWKAVILVVLISAAGSRIYAQQGTLVKPVSSAGIKNLNVGDLFPDFSIGKLVLSAKKTGRTAEFRDQLLIIDFWATSCSGCVAALPKMDALQKQFGAKVKILPVTYEKEAAVLSFWKNNKYTKNLSLSSVVEDQLFGAYFKHQTIPHEVWVYKGKVIGITTADYVDAINIQKVLSGEPVSWPVKNDFYVFDATKERLFHPDPNQLDTVNTFLKYAAISDYKEKVSAEGFGGMGIARDAKKKTIRAYFLNHPIYNAYLLSWMHVVNAAELVKPNLTMDPNQVVWEVAGQSRYTFTEGTGYLQSWLRKNGICFESVNPDSGQTDKEVYTSMIADLDRLLGLHARWEKRKEKVLVLVRTDKSKNLKSKKALTGYYDDRVVHKGSLHEFRDIPLNAIAYQLNKIAGNPYVFDETDYAEKTDLDLNFSSWTDISGIRKSLRAYGLDLKEEERLVDKFIFSEIEGGLFMDREMSRTAKARKMAQSEMKAPTAEMSSLFIVDNKKKPGVVTLPSGLQYKIIKPGNGPKPGPNDKVSIHYTGMLVNGKIFDSSFEVGRPYLAQVNGVIKGWTEALQLMPVGSKWIIYVPAVLAYGESSNSGTLPRNSNLIFEMELLGIVK